MRLSRSNESLWIKQPKEVDHFKYLGCMLTRDDYCTREIKMKIATAKEAFSRVWSIALNGSETWKLRKLDKKYLESFKMRCWRMEKIKRSEKVTNYLHGLWNPEPNEGILEPRTLACRAVIVPLSRINPIPHISLRYF